MEKLLKIVSALETLSNARVKRYPNQEFMEWCEWGTGYETLWIAGPDPDELKETHPHLLKRDTEAEEDAREEGVDIECWRLLNEQGEDTGFVHRRRYLDDIHMISKTPTRPNRDTRRALVKADRDHQKKRRQALQAHRLERQLAQQIAEELEQRETRRAALDPAKRTKSAERATRKAIMKQVCREAREAKREAKHGPAEPGVTS